MAEARPKKKIKPMAIFSRYSTILIFIVFVIISSIISSSFLSWGNITNLMKQNAALAIYSFGMLMVIMTGGIDLSVGAVVTLSNVLFAYQLAAGHNLAFSIASSLIAGCIAGAVSGYIVSYQKVAPFVTTLAMMQITRGVAYIICSGKSIQIQSDSYKLFSRLYVFGFPTQFIIMIVVFIIVALVFKYTTYGRLVLAIGSNEEAVRLSGIRTNIYRMSVYIISGFLAALAGMIVAGRTGVGSPLVGDGYENDAIASCVIAGASLAGGKGSVVNTLFGAFTLGLISNIMNLMKVPAYPQIVVKGVIILIAVLISAISDRSKATNT
ncbi:MAG: ABC transporter permease [Lachnospiraceae bacterium]|jgi:ribose transport system permease protein